MGIFRKLLFWVVILLFTWLVNIDESIAYDKVFVIVADELEWQDLQDSQLPNFQQLIEQGSIGLLNPISGGLRSRDNVLMTMVTGRPAVSPPNAKYILHRDEKFQNMAAADFYKSITGLEPAGELVHLGIKEIYKNNIPYYGRFSELLSLHQLNAMVIGSADYDGAFDRQLANVVINLQGVYQNGIMQKELLVSDEELPLLRKTDFGLLEDIVMEEWANNQIYFIEIADLMLLGKWRSWLMPNLYMEKKQKLLKEMDNWLEKILSNLDQEKDLFLIISPAPTPPKITDRDFLTPVIAWGKNFEPALLTSSTTKREGLVVIYDVLPTILNHYKINERIGVGGVMSSAGQSGSTESLLALNNRLLIVYQQRPLIIKTYIFLQIIIVSLAIFSIVFNATYRKGISIGLLMLSIIPFSLLVTSIFNNSLFRIIIANIGVTGILLYISWLGEIRRKMSGFLLIFALTSGALMLDLANNSYLMKQSILGYDPIAGARYYGLGNEYMGVLIGSGIMALALSFQLLQGKNIKIFNKVVLITGVLVVSFIGLPNLGTNVGGTIAAVVGFGFLYYKLFVQPVKSYQFFITAPLLILLFLISFVFFDLNRSVETQSHIGRTALLIKQEGANHLLDIVGRKIAMNVKLVRYTYWSRVFLVLLGSLILLFFRPPGLLAKKLANNPGLKAGVTAVTFASLVALAVNDSGIVAAATLMIYGAAPLIFHLLE